MNPQSERYQQFLADQVLTPFYEKRLQTLKTLTLAKVLKTKNPYLFRAKNIRTAERFTSSILDAFLSSQEETIFGNLLEGFAIFVSSLVDGGVKSRRASVDLEFTRAGTHYIVSIKSGTNWANADQISKMRDNFQKARESLRVAGVEIPIMAVNGCMYGTDANPLKNTYTPKGSRTPEPVLPDRVYYKYAGQVFWEFISGDANLYREMITPLGIEAQKRDLVFQAAYSSKLNEMTAQFTQQFLTADHQIDWFKIVDHASKRGISADLPEQLPPNSDEQ